MLDNLLEQKLSLNRAIVRSLREEVLSIKLAAENMAECATNIKGQGYLTFINSRENFLSKIDLFEKELTKNADIMIINNHTYP
jgi:hypothetical protein